MSGQIIQLPRPERLRIHGCGRDAENDHALCFYFNRPVTNDEMRFLHEVLKRACMTTSAQDTGESNG